MVPSGSVPQAPIGQQPQSPHGVLLQLEDKSPELEQIPGGGVGTAAIYTKNVKLTDGIR